MFRNAYPVFRTFVDCVFLIGTSTNIPLSKLCTSNECISNSLVCDMMNGSVLSTPKEFLDVGVSLRSGDKVCGCEIVLTGHPLLEDWAPPLSSHVFIGHRVGPEQRSVVLFDQKSSLSDPYREATSFQSDPVAGDETLVRTRRSRMPGSGVRGRVAVRLGGLAM